MARSIWFPRTGTPVPGDENIVKDHGRGFALTVYGVSKLRFITEQFPFRRVGVVLTDVGKPWSSVRDGKGKRKIFFSLSQGTAWKG